MRKYADLPVTVASLEYMPEDGNRYEVIEGELYVSTAPGFPHQWVLGNLHNELKEYLKLNKLGKVILGIGVVFDEFNGVIPDLVYVSNERFDRILAGSRLIAAPEIVIEILSPGKANEDRDKVAKRRLFTTVGVSEYWIVDPATRTLELQRKRKEGGLKRAIILQADDDLTTPLLPGFRVPVSQLFE
jgi:Uma2 family endonuclease